jgi:ABC-2 type transport system ATP-binding protein
MSGVRPGRSPEDRVTGWGLERVSVRYGHTVALQRVSIGVGSGAVTAVVGADGAGKSTLLRTLVGAQRAETGRVSRPAKRRIGYVSAGPGVYPDLTAEENMSFSAGAYGVPARVARARISELLERTELTSARRRLAGQLSGGMRQKLALAMAVIHQPDLLVLDEPTTGVDPVSRAELWRLVAGLAAEGTAIALATSYVDEAERATSVLVLLRGRMLAAGTAAEIVGDAPGELYRIAGPSHDPRAWRRGAQWRLWSPGGDAPPDAELLTPDLEDALVMAQLAVELGDGGAATPRVAA